MLKKIFLLAALALFTFAGQNEKIKASDMPFGYASIGSGANFGGYNGKDTKEVVVKDKKSLLKYAKMGNYVIYLDGFIDLSEGKIPQNDQNGELDKFVNEISGGEFSSYLQFIKAYAASCHADKDGSQDPKMAQLRRNLANSWKKLIVLPVASNTTIIGLGESSGIKGGEILLKNVQNIAIRNIKFEDAFDPFPDIQKNDGFNAQYDALNIDTSKNIWIDHCHLKDTINLNHVQLAGGETTKWQTYDGLCDIKGESTAITVSNNIFENHDKTMLIGARDSDGSNKRREVTIADNIFKNCAQRLPMVRNAKVHIYNNFYDSKNGFYDQKYAIGVRFGSLIYEQNNYFANGIKFSFKCNNGEFFTSGNTDLSKKHTICKELAQKPFEPPYSYKLQDALDLQSYLSKRAGNGKVQVEK